MVFMLKKIIIYTTPHIVPVSTVIFFYIIKTAQLYKY